MDEAAQMVMWKDICEAYIKKDSLVEKEIRETGGRSMEKVILISIPFAVAVFAVQTLLFSKTSRTIIHLIPIFVIGMFYLTALGLVISDIAAPSGCVKMNTLYALILAVADTVALIADGTAWLIEKV